MKSEYSHYYPCTPRREGRTIPFITILAICSDVSCSYLQTFLQLFLLEQERKSWQIYLDVLDAQNRQDGNDLSKVTVAPLQLNLNL